MKITLEGYRTYLDKTVVTFPEKGTTLIEGMSGQGKSTLFKAVVWALYGKDKAYNWSTTKKKCYVQLELDKPQVIILRQKNPERVSVTTEDNTVLESEEAQLWIVKQWGSYEAWCASSYIAQKSRSLWIYGSAAERLALLEEWAFAEERPSTYIEEFQEKRKKAVQNYDQCQTVYQGWVKTLGGKPGDLEFEWDEYTDENQRLYSEQLTLLEAKWEQYLQKEQHQVLLTNLNTQIEETEQEIVQKQESIWDAAILKDYELVTQQLEKYETVQQQTQDLQKKIFLLKYNGPTFETLPVWQHHLEQQTLAEDQAKKLKALGYISREDVESYCTHLDDNVFPHYDFVKEYKSLSSVKHVLIPDKTECYTEADIQQAIQQTTLYEKFTTDLKTLKLTENTLETVKADIKRFLQIPSSCVKAYQEWKKCCSTVDEDVPSSQVDTETLTLELETCQQHVRDSEQSLQVLECPHCHDYVRLINRKLVASKTPPSTSEELALLKKQESIIKRQIECVQWKSQWKEVDREELEWILVHQRNLPSIKEHAKILNLTVISKPEISSQQMSQHNTMMRKLELEKYMTTHKIHTSSKEFSQPLSTLQKTHHLLSQILADWKVSGDCTTEQLHQGLQRFRFQQQEKELQENLKALYVDDIEERDVQTRKQCIKEQQNLVGQLKQLQKSLDKVYAEKKKTEQLLEQLEQEDPEEIKGHIEAIRQFLEECHDVLPWKAREKELMAAEQQCKELDDVVQSWTQIIEKAKWLENTLLEQCLVTINTILENVIGAVFADPLNIRFELFKGERPTVQLTMLYKGGQNEPLSELSGGEVDRVTLGLTLAAAVSSPFPYLLLDECFGSLDTEAREKCLETMRLLLPHKSIYVIAHGETEGDYSFKHVV